MSKIEQYLDKVNVILKDADWTQIEQYQNSISKKLVVAFSEVYGAEMVTREQCAVDHGFAMVPALIKTSAGKVYLGLLSVCVQDSGENYGAQIFFRKYGVVEQENFKFVLSKKEFNYIFPYRYRPLVQIAGDIHTDGYF